MIILYARQGEIYEQGLLDKELIGRGVEIGQIVYVNFEDERLLEAKADDLNVILEIGIEMAGAGQKPYLFLDEIQNIEGWEKFARRVADMKYRIHITGSNSRMLSSEIASTLGGRFMIVQIFPYDFSEYLSAHGMTKEYSGTMRTSDLSTPDRAELIGLYNRYLEYGAFPELIAIRNKRGYLNNIYQTIYLGDIIARNRITNILKSSGASIGKQTVINYVGYTIDSYLLFRVCNYAAKLVEKETSPKYYFMDTGLLGLLLLDGISARMENLAAIELTRRYVTLC